jgi:hypothetical protein
MPTITQRKATITMELFRCEEVWRWENVSFCFLANKTKLRLWAKQDWSKDFNKLDQGKPVYLWIKDVQVMIPSCGPWCCWFLWIWEKFARQVKEKDTHSKMHNVSVWNEVESSYSCGDDLNQSGKHRHLQKLRELTVQITL